MLPKKQQISVLPTPLFSNETYGFVYPSSKITLKILSEDNILFSHALLFTHGNWKRDPLRIWVDEENPVNKPFIITFTDKLLHGLNIKDSRQRIDDSWEYKIFCINKSEWESLYRYFSTLAGINKEEGRFHRLLPQTLPVPDILALQKTVCLPKICPMVNITTFGIDGNKECIFFTPALNPPIDKPKVVKGEPEIETVELANKVFTGKCTVYKNTDSFKNLNIETLLDNLENIEEGD